MNFLRSQSVTRLGFNIGSVIIAVSRRLHAEAVEECFTVPWGCIAGKRWGKQSGQPIVALHGMFDNAASFDKLIPLLNVSQPILALDIPGYGKSSNPPPGMLPNFFEVLMWIRYFIKHTLKLEKVTFLGHSFGSNLSFHYSGLFPEEVDKYISIDCSKVNMSSRPLYLLDDLRRAYQGGIWKGLSGPREGNFDVFLNFMMRSREKVDMPLRKEFCEILLNRDLIMVGEDHYKSAVDGRPYLRYMARSTLTFQEELSKKIKCEVLTIRATKGIIVDERLEIYEQHVDNMKKNSPKVVSKTAQGGHHVHLENPEEVASHINGFLN